MKVELLVTLRGNIKVWPAGTVFTDPLPEEIQSEIALNRGTVKVHEDPKPVAPPPPRQEPELEPSYEQTEGLQLDETLEAMEAIVPELEKEKPVPKKRAAPKKKSTSKKKATSRKKSKLSVPTD